MFSLEAFSQAQIRNHTGCNGIYRAYLYGTSCGGIPTIVGGNLPACSITTGSVTVNLNGSIEYDIEISFDGGLNWTPLRGTCAGQGCVTAMVACNSQQCSFEFIAPHGFAVYENTTCGPQSSCW